MVPKPASHGPVASDPHRGLPGPHLYLVTQALHLDLVTLVPTWTSLGPGDSLSNMDLTWIW